MLTDVCSTRAMKRVTAAQAKIISSSASADSKAMDAQLKQMEKGITEHSERDSNRLEVLVKKEATTRQEEAEDISNAQVRKAKERCAKSEGRDDPGHDKEPSALVLLDEEPSVDLAPLKAMQDELEELVNIELPAASKASNIQVRTPSPEHFLNVLQVNRARQAAAEAERARAKWMDAQRADDHAQLKAELAGQQAAAFKQKQQTAQQELSESETGLKNAKQAYAGARKQYKISKKQTREAKKEARKLKKRDKTQAEKTVAVLAGNKKAEEDLEDAHKMYTQARSRVVQEREQLKRYKQRVSAAEQAQQHAVEEARQATGWQNETQAVLDQHTADLVAAKDKLEVTKAAAANVTGDANAMKEQVVTGWEAVQQTESRRLAAEVMAQAARRSQWFAESQLDQAKRRAADIKHAVSVAQSASQVQASVANSTAKASAMMVEKELALKAQIKEAVRAEKEAGMRNERAQKALKDAISDHDKALTVASAAAQTSYEAQSRVLSKESDVREKSRFVRESESILHDAKIHEQAKVRGEQAAQRVVALAKKEVDNAIKQRHVTQEAANVTPSKFSRAQEAHKQLVQEITNEQARASNARKKQADDIESAEELSSSRVGASFELKRVTAQGTIQQESIDSKVAAAKVQLGMLEEGVEEDKQELQEAKQQEQQDREGWVDARQQWTQLDQQRGVDQSRLDQLKKQTDQIMTQLSAKSVKAEADAQAVKMAEAERETLEGRLDRQKQAAAAAKQELGFFEAGWSQEKRMLQQRQQLANKAFKQAEAALIESRKQQSAAATSVGLAKQGAQTTEEAVEHTVGALRLANRQAAEAQQSKMDERRREKGLQQRIGDASNRAAEKKDTLAKVENEMKQEASGLAKEEAKLAAARKKLQAKQRELNQAEHRTEQAEDGLHGATTAGRQAVQDSILKEEAVNTRQTEAEAAKKKRMRVQEAVRMAVQMKRAQEATVASRERGYDESKIAVKKAEVVLNAATKHYAQARKQELEEKNTLVTKHNIIPTV